MISIGHAQSGEAPSVFDIRIKGKIVCFERQRSAAGMNFHGSCEVVTQSILKASAPAGRVGRQTSQGEKVRRKVETRIESPAAVKTDILGVQFVEIMKDSVVREAFVIVERMLEETYTARITIEHQVFADETGRVGETIGKLFVGREQQQTRGLRAVRADYDGLAPFHLHY